MMSTQKLVKNVMGLTGLNETESLFSLVKLKAQSMVISNESKDREIFYSQLSDLLDRLAEVTKEGEP